MEKRRPFMLMTILLLVLFAFISWLYVIKAGWRLSVGIDYMVYGNDFTFIFGCVEVVFGGLEIILNNLLVPVSLFFILVAFVFFLLSKKRAKLAIPTYVLLVIAFLTTMGSFFTIVGFESLASLKDMVMYILGASSSMRFYGGYAVVPESVAIESAVYGGLMMLVHGLFLLTAILPLVTLVLSFVLGRKKKQEDVEVIA